MRRLDWFKTSLFIILSLFFCIHVSLANGATLDGITISPASPSITLDRTQQFTVKGNYSDGSQQDLTEVSEYKSSSTSVTTISTKGLATPIASGSANIEVRYHEKRSSTTITISPSSGTATSSVPASMTLTTRPVH